MKKITSFTETVVNKNKKADTPVGNFGFTIEKEDIRDFAAEMTALNAATLKLTYTRCSTINNRNFMMVMWTPSMLTLKQRFALFLFKRWF